MAHFGAERRAGVTRMAIQRMVFERAFPPSRFHGQVRCSGQSNLGGTASWIHLDAARVIGENRNPWNRCTDSSSHLLPGRVRFGNVEGRDEIRFAS